MEKEILVSIICTAYNHEKYIKDALEGFVMQKTNFAFEALVHDDASTDGTADIIREYAEKYPDIIKPILQTENQHSKRVRITSDIILPKTKGKYVAFCEGDDFWTDENKLQKQIDFLENNDGYIACAHNTIVHDCSGTAQDELMVQREDEHDVEFEDVIWGLRHAYHTSALVVKKEYLKNFPEFYNVAVKYGFGDFPRAIWYTIVGKTHFLPYTMSTYRLMSGETSWSSKNHTHSRSLRNKEGVMAMLEEVKNHVSDERKALLDKAILEQKFFWLEQKYRFKEMMKPPFLEYWKKQPLIFKIKIFIKMLLPTSLYKKVTKLKD